MRKERSLMSVFVGVTEVIQVGNPNKLQAPRCSWYEKHGQGAIFCLHAVPAFSLKKGEKVTENENAKSNVLHK